MTHPDIVKAFILLQRAYPRWAITPEVVDSWAMLLEGTPPAEILRGAVEYMRGPSAEYPPSIGQIRTLAVRPDEERLSPEEAWSEVVGEIRRVGWIGTPQYSTEAIKRAASSLGSWRTLCSQTSDDLAANRAHFYRSYSAFAHRATREAEHIALGPIMDKLLGSGATMLKKPDEMYGGAIPENVEPPRAEADPMYSRAEIKKAEEMEIDLQ